MMTDIISLGAKHIWLPYTQMQNHLPQLEVEYAKGTKIFLKDGRNLIDGIASWWSMSHGYNHPHLVSEITKQVKKLSHIMLAGFANDQTYKLAYRLCKFSNMDHVFFSDSGSTAVEVAMKIAWQLNINLKQTNKTKFISFKNSYHGDTTGAMSLADLSSGMHKKFQKILLKNFSLEIPKNKRDLEKFEQFIVKNKETLAGVFIEPIVQCAGGMRFHSKEILHEIFLITKKHDILFIVDECAVGFYRTGKKFAFNHAKIIPDILILGKALTGGMITLAATLVSKTIYKSFKGNSLDLALMHGPTFMGNPLSCAAANASLDLFEKENYAKKTLEIEKIFTKNLEKCRKIKGVKDIRIIGAIAAIEIDVSWNQVLKLRQKFIESEVFLRPLSNCVYMMPPLNITKADLQKITNTVFEILSANSNEG